MPDPTHKLTIRQYIRQGEPFVWVTAAGLSAITLMTIVFILIILANGLGFFWPKTVEKFDLADADPVYGYVVEVDEAKKADRPTRYRVKVGNRDLYGQDFRWIGANEIQNRETPADIIVVERLEYGNFHGTLAALQLAEGQDASATVNKNVGWANLQNALEQVDEEQAELAELRDTMTVANRKSESLQNKLLKLRHEQSETSRAGLNSKIEQLEAEIRELDRKFESLQVGYLEKESRLLRNKVVFEDAAGMQATFALAHVVRVWRPNQMDMFAKMKFYAAKVVELLVEEPRESNTEGGLFPAIFGTVMMVLIMSFFAIPFGVVAAIYLREYARDGPFVRLVRVSVNNLAGVPSIVYGVFGLGFFIYTVGSSIDQVFFPHALPTPTFGTGGILWASLTLALLTVPVVIVSTEEALAAIPQEVREGSLALGATKFQTLTRILLPMSTPGILTGFILAMARAAGEVAPLMLTGAVKLAPEMPFDAQFPWLHLDRKFMHLGFHIYDLAFQSPNVEAVLPMVYVTTMLLLSLVILLSVAAIVLRNKMRKRLTSGVF